MCTQPKHIRLKSVGLWRYRHGYRVPLDIDVPCGSCPDCVAKKQNHFAARLYEETKYVSHLFFITLTYAPEYEPWAVSLWNRNKETGEMRRVTDPQPIFHPETLSWLRMMSAQEKYNVQKSQCRIFEQVIHLVPNQFFNSFIAYERPKPILFDTQRFYEGKRDYVKPKCVRHRDNWYHKKSVRTKELFEGLKPSTRFERVIKNLHTDSLPDPREFTWNGRVADNCELVARYTPTLYVRDLMLTLTNWRRQFEFKTGTKLPPFKYAAVGEYGSEFTQRPHLHLLMFGKGLTKELVENFLSFWDFGRTDLRLVNRLNPDKTDAFALLSSYVAKYVTKGDFATEGVKEGLTLIMRNCCSKKLGQVLDQTFIDDVLCKQHFQYDQEYADDLPEDIKSKLIPMVADKLKYTIKYSTKSDASAWELTMSMPMAFQKQIFNYHVDKLTGEGCFSALYYLVKDYLRSRAEESDNQQFREFLASWRGSPYDACVAFHNLQEEALKAREASKRQMQKRVYAKRKSTR